MNLGQENFEAISTFSMNSPINEEFQNKMQTIYSVKYCGVTNGEIGILTKKIPVIGVYKPIKNRPFYNPPPRSAPRQSKEKTQFIQNKLPAKILPEVMESVHSTARDKNTEKSEEIQQFPPPPEYVPISAVNIVNLNTFESKSIENKEENILKNQTIPERLNTAIPSKKYKCQKISNKTSENDSQIRIGTSIPNKRGAKSILSEIIKGQKQENQVKVIRNLKTSFPKFRNFDEPEIAPRLCCTTVHGKRQNSFNCKKGITSFYNDVIHTYSIPRALSGYRKLAENIHHEPLTQRYNKEQVCLAVYNKVAGVRHSNSGFKGHNLTVSELKKAMTYFSKFEQKSSTPQAVQVLKPNFSQTFIEKSQNDPEKMFQNSVIKEKAKHHEQVLSELARRRRDETNRKGFEKMIKEKEKIEKSSFEINGNPEKIKMTNSSKEIYLEYLKYKHKK